MKAWIARRYSGYTPAGKFWFTVGLAVLTVDMAIGFLGGISVGTFWHGVGYAALAAGFCFLPDAAYEEFEQRRFVSGLVIAVLCIPIGIKAYEQQLTYSTGVRQGEMQMTNVVNRRYDGAQDDVTRHREELTMLMGVLETARREAPWAATVKAEGLRNQVATLDAAIKEEGSPKNGGCKRRCLDLMKEKTEAEKQIAGAEKVENAEARIKHLQSAIDTKREKADTAEHKQSINFDVAVATATVVNILRGAAPEDAIKVDNVSMQYATLASGGLGSLSLLLLSPISIFLAGRRRINRSDDDPSAPASITPPVSDLGNRKPETRAHPLAPINVTRLTVGDINREKLRRILDGYVPHQGSAAAA